MINEIWGRDIKGFLPEEFFDNYVEIFSVGEHYPKVKLLEQYEDQSINSEFIEIGFKYEIFDSSEEDGSYNVEGCFINDDLIRIITEDKFLLTEIMPKDYYGGYKLKWTIEV